MTMTKEEILEMKPGRELDVLVAKEVFGIEVEWDYAPWDINKQLPKLPFRKGEPRTALGPMAHSVANTIYEYSTDISAAWLVVEELANDGKHSWFWSIHYAKNWATVDLCCSMGHGRNTGHSIPGVAGETIPEAICKAALLAKLNL